MKMYNYLKLFVYTLFLVLTFTGCQKDYSLPIEESWPTDYKQLAQAWYAKNSSLASSKSNSLDFSKLKVEWDAYSYNLNESGDTVISVPITSEKDTYYREIGLTKNVGGVPFGIIKEYIGDPFVENTLLNIYSGSGTLLERARYNFASGDMQYIIVRKKAKNLAKAVKNKIACVGCSGNMDDGFEIEEVVVIGYTGGGGGGTPPPHDPDPTIPSYPGGGGGGGGGGGNSSGGIGAFEIRSNLQNYPCAQQAYQYMLSSKSKIASFFHKVFGGKQTAMNLTFNAVALGENYDGWNRGVDVPINDAQIDLSTFILQNSTQEYILSTMYHEAWHAYLDVERHRLGSAFGQIYPEVKTYTGYDGNTYQVLQEHSHGLFSEFIDLMKLELKNFNSNLSDEVIDALVTGGILEGRSNRQIELSHNERDTRKNKYKGTKCSGDK